VRERHAERAPRRLLGDAARGGSAVADAADWPLAPRASAEEEAEEAAAAVAAAAASAADGPARVAALRAQMRAAARRLDFEGAAALQAQVAALEGRRPAVEAEGRVAPTERRGARPGA